MGHQIAREHVGISLCSKTFSISFRANFGSLSISSNLALSQKKDELRFGPAAVEQLPDLETLEDVEVAVVLVRQLLVPLQSQEGLRALRIEH